MLAHLKIEEEKVVDTEKEGRWVGRSAGVQRAFEFFGGLKMGKQFWNID